jgi:hypothetical protein
MAKRELKYDRRKVAELAADPANARKHNQRNLDAIKASLQRFGQQKPIVIDKSGVVRAGNGTLAAAQALGWAEIDCVVTELTGADATAYAIADNRTAELAEWDNDVLAATLQSLEHEDAALLECAGFTGAELSELAGAFDAEGGEMPWLRSGDREPFQQMTFTLHDSQAARIKEAIGFAKENGGAVSGVNENSNGNALAWLVEQVLARS